MESSLLGYVRLPSKKLISTQGDGLASSKAHSTSSKGKKEEGKGRGGWTEIIFPWKVYIFWDFLAAGNAATAANVVGEMIPWVRRIPRREQRQMDTFLIGRRPEAHPSVPLYPPWSSWHRAGISGGMRASPPLGFH